MIHVLIAPDFAMWFWLDMQWKKPRIKSRTCLYNPLQFFSGPWQMSQYACLSSKILCVVNLIGNRMRAKSLGIALGLVNARPPGRAKFANAPPSGTDKAGKCPPVARGGGGGGARCSCNWRMHYCQERSYLRVNMALLLTLRLVLLRISIITINMNSGVYFDYQRFFIRFCESSKSL